MPPTSPRSRPIQPSDLDGLLATARAADTALWGQPETDLDELSHELSVSAPLERTSRIVPSTRGIDGFVLVRATECVLTLHPSPTGARRDEVAAQLLSWAQRVGATELDIGAPDTELAEVASARGWQHRHSSHELMRRHRVPTPALPSGVELRPFLPDRHAPAVHRMLYAFWAETPTHHDRPYDQWRSLFVDHPGSDPDHDVVAWQDGEVVGAALCRIFAGETGWVLQLGVAPHARGRGLGRALLCIAADRLGGVVGVQEVGLSVDASNDAALNLYRAAGFTVERTYHRHRVQPQTERSNE